MGIYQIGLILVVAVGVLGSALMIAWRDANRDIGREEASRHNSGVSCSQWRRNPDGIRDRTL